MDTREHKNTLIRMPKKKPRTGADKMKYLENHYTHPIHKPYGPSGRFSMGSLLLTLAVITGLRLPHR